MVLNLKQALVRDPKLANAKVSIGTGIKVQPPVVVNPLLKTTPKVTIGNAPISEPKLSLTPARFVSTPKPTGISVEEPTSTLGLVKKPLFGQTKIGAVTADTLIEKARLEKQKTKIGAGEAFTKAIEGFRPVPFVGAVVGAAKTGELAIAAKRVDTGAYDGSVQSQLQKANDEKLLKDFVAESQRDSTFGAKVVSTVMELPSFGLEFLLTGGLATLGKKGAEKAGSEVLKKLAGKEGAKWVEEKIAKNSALNLTSRVASGTIGETLRTPVAGGARILEGTVQKQLPLIQDKEGVLDIQDEMTEPIGTSMLKAFGEQWAETVSERSGGLFSKVAAPLLNKIPKIALFSAFRQANPNFAVKTLRDITKATGWNGIINEMAEEQVGMGLNALLNQIGMSDQKFRLPTKEELLVQLVAFSVPSVGYKLAEMALQDKKLPNQQETQDMINNAPDGPKLQAKTNLRAENTPFIEAATKANEYLKRLGVQGIEVKQVEKILAPDQGEALGVTYADKIALVPVVTKWTAEHEVLHTVMRHYDTIPALRDSGVTRDEVLASVMEQHVKDAERYKPEEINANLIEEWLAQDFEQYLQDKSIVPSNSPITKFFEALVRIFKQLFGTDKTNLNEKSQAFFKYLSEYEAGTNEQVIIKPKNFPARYLQQGKNGIIINFKKTGAQFKKKVPQTKEEAKKAFLADIGRAIERKMTQKITRAKLSEKIRLQKENIESVKREIIEYAKGLLDLHDKGKLLTIVKNAKNYTDLREARTFIDTLQDQAKRRTLINQIREELKTTEEAKKAFLADIGGAIERKMTQKITRAKLSEKIRLQKENIESVKREIIEYAKGLLDLHDKGKLLTIVKNAKNYTDLQEARTFIDTLQDQAKRRTLINQIREELKTTKAKKQGGILKGKFGADVQRVLDLLADSAEMKIEDAQKKIQANLERYQDSYPPAKVALENRILSLTADRKNQSVENLQLTLDLIKALKENSAMTRDLLRFNIGAEVQRRTEHAVDKITGGRGIKAGRATTGAVKKKGWAKFRENLKTLGVNYVLDWNGLIDILEFNTNVKDKTLPNLLSVDEPERNQKTDEHARIVNFNENFSRIYNIPNKSFDIHKTIGKMSEEKNLGTFKNLNGVEVEIKMSRDQAIKRWEEHQDATLDDSFREGNKYTKEIWNAIESILTEQDKQFADWQIAEYEKQYQRINPIYSLINGVDLPHQPNYTPIRREGYTQDVSKGYGMFIEEVTTRNAVTSSSLKSRVENTYPLALVSALSTFDAHMAETNYYINWVEKMRQLDTIFKNPEVREAIKQEFGSQMITAIDQVLNDFSTRGNKTGLAIPFVDWFRKNFTVGALMAKPNQAIKQLTSVFAYLEELSVGDLISGIRDFVKHPYQNYDILKKESSFIATRGENIDRDMKDAIDQGYFDRYKLSNNFKDLMMLFTKVGDKLSIALGSWAIRKKGLAEGKPLEEIIRDYENISNNTQQSSDLSRLSAIQRNRNSLGRLFTMFISAPRQYLQKELLAINSLFREGGTTPENLKKVARVIFIYHVLIPFMFSFVSNLGRWDDEAKKEYLRAVLLGPLDGLFIFGDMVDKLIRTALGMQIWDSSIPLYAIVDNVIKLFNNLKKSEEIGDEEFMKAMEQGARVANITGIPFEQAVDVTAGVQRIVQGQTKRGIANILGWSDYAAGVDTSKSTPDGMDFDIDLDLDLDMDLNLDLDLGL